ncbi:MAG: hypothetical protein AAGF49_07515 [Pseudomonadota bacterium]
MRARILAIALALIAVAGIVVMWRNLSILRGTALNDLRFVVFAVGTFAVLSVAQRLSAFLAARLEGGGEGK